MTDERRPRGSGAESSGQVDAATIPPSADKTELSAVPRDASVTRVTRVTPMTAAERAREYRKRKRDAVVEALVTPSTVTPVTPDVTPVMPVAPAGAMTKGERDELKSLARRQTKDAKARIEVRAAELRADVEAKLSAEFAATDGAWADALRMAQESRDELNRRVEQVCDERGVPQSFRPHFGIGYSGRGENASAGRRAELRKLADTRIEHLSRLAKQAIEAQETETLTALIVGGLTSDAAREFLARMPDPRQLMEEFALAELGDGGGR